MHRNAFVRLGAMVRSDGVHMFFSSILCVIAMALLLGTYLAAVQKHERMTTLYQAPRFTINVDPSTTENQLGTLLQALRNLPQIRSAESVSRDQLYEVERGLHPDIVRYYEEQFIANPFSDSLSFTLRSLADTASVIAFLQRPELRSVIPPDTFSSLAKQQDMFWEDYAAADFMRSLLFAAVGAAFFLTLLGMVFLARDIASRREKELLLMHFSGADGWMLLKPVFIEAGSLCAGAFAVAGLLVSSFAVFMPDFFPSFVHFPGMPESVWSLGGLFLLLAGGTYGACLFSVHRARFTDMLLRRNLLH